MGLLKSILILAITVWIIYYIYKTLFSKTKFQLTGIKDATSLQDIPYDILPANLTNSFAYSIWFNVSQWTETAQPKILLERITSRTGMNDKYAPKITLGRYENDITIDIDTLTGNGGSAAPFPPCIIQNFPLQKWVNLIVSLNNRTLDVYLNGKLTRTCVLPAPADVSTTANVKLTPNGGFTGRTSNLEYFSGALNPQEAYNIYKKGYTSYGFGSLFEKYKIKVSYLVDGVEEGEWQI